MKITLTGSHGFIGTHLRSELVKMGHHLDCWDSKIGKNINNFKLPSDTQLVIHLAAKADVRASMINPSDYWQQNVINSKSIFNQCEKKDVKVLYASSSTTKQWWRNPYATTKRVCEEIAPENSCGMRFSTVWGPGARPTMLVPKIKNKTLTYATEHIRDFIHVSDVVSGILTIMKRGSLGIVDVGSGKAVRVDQLVAYNGLDVPIESGKDHEQEENVLPSTDLRSLGWQPKIDILESDLSVLA